MKNCFLVIISLLCFGLPSLAQQPDAEEVLNRALETLRTPQGLKVTFTIRSTNSATSGVLYMKGEKFKLDIDGVTTWFDGRTQWSYLASSDEVNVSQPTPQEIQSINPYALLLLHKQGYSLKMGKIGNEQDRTTYKLILMSTDRKQDFQCIILYINKTTYSPIRISMAQRNGEVTLLLVDSYETGRNYPDSFFVFNKKEYPTAEVIDLR